MELLKALNIAENIVRQLKPHCDRIEIAGSIRRKKPEVKDIEIVCIPKQVQQTNIFQEVIGSTPSPGFIELVSSWEKVKGDPKGKYTQRILPDGIKLDLFMVNTDNWGLQLAIRTGSAEYSHKVLASTWVKRGYKAEEGILYKKSKPGIPVPVREERDLFLLLNLTYKEPEQRNL